MRVLHFVHQLPPGYSGAAFQAIQLSKQLQKNKVQSYVCGFIPECGFKSSIDDKTVGVQNRHGLFKILVFIDFLRIILRVKPDIVHVHGYYAPIILIAACLKKSLVLKTTLYGTDDLNTISSKNFWDRYLVSKIDVVISLTEQLKAANIKHSKTVLVPNGVCFSRFHLGMRENCSIKLRRALGLQKSVRIFLFAGGDSVRKGSSKLYGLWETVCSILGESSVHLVVCGNFKEVNAYASLVNKFRNNVTVWPHTIPRIEDILCGADVLLMLSRQEGLPNVVLEAVACGTFVISFKIPGVYNGVLAEGVNAIFICDERDSRLAKIFGLYRESQDYKANYSDFYNNFSSLKVTQQYLEIYSELLV